MTGRAKEATQTEQARAGQRWDASTIFFLASLAGAVALAGYTVVLLIPHADEAAAADLTLEAIPFNGARAFTYLKKQCDFGPRPSGSAAMALQQAWLIDHFTNLGGKVSRQEFKARHPNTGEAVPMANIIVQWHPERKQRLLLCTHYDTRPFPDRDPKNPRGKFVGANDGASGTAILCELAHEMKALETKWGVDFVLFDGEELVFSDDRKDPYFLGAEYFARDYAANPPDHKYAWGVLLDMVGDAELQIFYDRYSISRKETRPLANDIWTIAGDLKVREFIKREGYDVLDDHLRLNELGHIPTIDIIDFHYPRQYAREPYWHTTQDTPEHCSALSLAKVGYVVKEWLKRQK